ncbi:MAG: ribosome maturation factor RimP [Clostridia bacterium]|nr:ribosome maturation factor RimP [Clostridia bacterium]MDD7701055.1 ribosome maturation factor RimP [Eubacteriales bacterium]MDY2827369.1 ribosome maturation factor RimP [Eubacteriales bacterium]
MATGKNIPETVRALAEPVAATLSLSVWDVEFVKEGSRQVLRITIDKEGGVTIDDCEAMHRAMDPVLDEADPIATPYYLEISSPGVERELRTDAQLSAFVGATVRVRLFAPAAGTRNYQGELLTPGTGGEIRIRNAEGEFSFPRASVAKINTVFEF